MAKTEEKIVKLYEGEPKNLDERLKITNRSIKKSTYVNGEWQWHRLSAFSGTVWNSKYLPAIVSALAGFLDDKDKYELIVKLLKDLSITKVAAPEDIYELILELMDKLSIRKIGPIVKPKDKRLTIADMYGVTKNITPYILRGKELK